MKQALRYHPSDDVAVVLEEVKPGEQIQIQGEETICTSRDTIPAGHKMATCEMEASRILIKSGQPIARTTQAIHTGEYVHCHNVEGLIESWEGGKLEGYDSSKVQELPESFRLTEMPKLFGYRRKDGSVGFRNHLLVVSTVVCANHVVEQAGIRFPQIATITNPTGCLMLANERERMNTVLLSMARNPNVGAVVFVGLGCETVDAEWFFKQVQGEKLSAWIRIQDEHSTEQASETLNQTIETMLDQLAAQEREPVPVSDICVGTKCGGSDWTTTVVSNPAIGYVSDVIVKNGGTSLLGETMGWFGGEDMLVRQARTRETAQGILALMQDIYNRALAVGKRVDEGNPTPGNKAGGITTLNEKALGNVKKGGSAPIEGALAFGEKPCGKGLYVTDNPGLDPISLLGLTCSGANVLLFSTGRGTPTGTPLAPAIKLTGSPAACAAMGAHIDVDLSGVVTGSMTFDEAGKRLLQELFDVCNGKETISEKLRHREYAFPLVMGPL